jgi:ankyrin repeat protein
MTCCRLVKKHKKILFFLILTQTRLLFCAAVDTTKSFSDAIVAGDIALVKKYIDKKVEVNGTDAEGNAFLHLAVRSQCGKSYEIIRLLCQAGADPNAVDFWGMTPLHHAAVIGKVPAVRILLKHKADVNVLDKDLSSPIHKSVVWQNRCTYELLRNEGAKLDLGQESVFSVALRLFNR